MNEPKRDSAPADEGRLETPVRQHTPGPWRWWGCKDGSYNPMNDYAQIASGRERVAQVRIASTSEANLRLMVAAPDLLAALNAMLTHMGMDEDEWNRPTFEQARRAVAKAVFVLPNVGIEPPRSGRLE